MRTFSMMFFGLLALVSVGCVGSDDADSTAPTAQGAASDPLLLGRMSHGLEDEDGDGETDLTVRVNGEDRDAAVDEDALTFVVRSLPTGDLVVEIEAEGLRGTIELVGVERGEIIEVAIDQLEGGLEIRITRRDRAAEPEVPPDDDDDDDGDDGDDGGVDDGDDGPPEPDEGDDPLPRHEGSIEIRDNNTAMHLERGIYIGRITILGNNVTLLGFSDGSCDEDARTILEGPLEIRGNNARLVNLLIRGERDVKGNNASFFDECADHPHHGDGRDDGDHDDDDDDDDHEGDDDHGRRQRR